MAEPDFKLAWTWRSREPATSPPNPAYPAGLDVVLAKPGHPACSVPLPYPAPGVGSWVLTCGECGHSAVITAAGRADDPRSVSVPCQNKVN